MQHRSNAPLELETFLPYRLNVLATLVSESLARIYEELHGITVPEWRVLATLGQFGTVTASAISSHAFMHKTKVSRAVGDLVSRGLVERQPSARDKRESLLSLTAEGHAVYEDLVPRARAFAVALEGELTDGELAALDRILTRLTVRSQAIAGNREIAAKPRDAKETSS